MKILVWSLRGQGIFSYQNGVSERTAKLISNGWETEFSSTLNLCLRTPCKRIKNWFVQMGLQKRPKTVKICPSLKTPFSKNIWMFSQPHGTQIYIIFFCLVSGILRRKLLYFAKQKNKLKENKKWTSAYKDHNDNGKRGRKGNTEVKEGAGQKKVET